jgi:hypothetical protein
MPAVIEKKTTAKKAPAKKAAVKKAQPKAAAPKKEKFVAPAKPTVEPTSLERSDYGYTDGQGKFRFWQGYDAKFKKNLMVASRVLPQTETAKKARRILVENGWSTDEREQAMVDLAQQKADRIVARATAKAEKENAKKAKAEATKTAVAAPAEDEGDED